MDFFKWKDSFCIGIEEIDRQHRTFLEYLNICHLNVSGSDRERIDTALFDNLREYAVTHFLFEEALMQSEGYHDLEQQMKQHRYFESQIHKLKVTREKGNKKVTEELLTFMRDWFLDHILIEDKKIKPMIKETVKQGKK